MKRNSGRSVEQHACDCAGYEHACAISDLAAQMRSYLDANNSIADTYPAQVLVLQLMLDECKKRAGLLIELAGD